MNSCRIYQLISSGNYSSYQLYHFFSSFQGCSHHVVKPTSITPELASHLTNYKILNPGDEIILYRYGRRPVLGKEVANYNPEYYFSAPGMKYLQPLTISNVVNAFNHDPSFQQKIRSTFKNDKDLLNINPVSKRYTISELKSLPH